MSTPVIALQQREISSCNILKVSAGTNCPQGGDGGHGGRTVLNLKDVAGTCWDVTVVCRDGESFTVSPMSIEIVMSGDSECDTFAEALEHAAATLRKQWKAIAEGEVTYWVESKR